MQLFAIAKDTFSHHITTDEDNLMRSLRTAALLSLLTITSAAFGGTWYVATTGSDSNAGTLASPFATIKKGVSMLSAPGDVLDVRGGTYTLSSTDDSVIIWNKAGTLANPIRVQNYPNETPVIDGTNTTHNGTVEIDSSSYVNFDGFEVKNGPHTGILVYDSNNVKVRWNTVHDCQSNGIGVSGSALDNAHDVTIDGNVVKYCVKSNSARTLGSGWSQALSAYKATNITIQNNYVHENWGEGIDYIDSTHGTIKNNSMWDNFSVNLYLDNAQYVTVDSNFIITGWADTDPTLYYRNNVPALGICIANEYYTTQRPETDATISNNIVVGTTHGFSYGNWEYGGGMHNTIIANNTFYDTGDTMLYIEDGSGGTHVHDTTTIENNVFQQTGTTKWLASAPTVGITYSHNAWYGGASGHSVTGSGDITSDPKLVNPGNYGGTTDYKLHSTSPCINAGYTETAVTHDYWGTTRTSGSYDIGAHEY
jgi:parallel beta-helix repeat protein